MDEHSLTEEDRHRLLEIARQAIDDTLEGRQLQPIILEELPEGLRKPGASFVTLTKKGELRGCVGALEAYQPLAEDVQEHAVAAAFKDYRFPPLELFEFQDINIEISCLTNPKPLKYHNPEELIQLLRPNIDGVIIQDGVRRATFLPQVWEKIPNPALFLSHLCQKMGVDSNMWRYKKMKIFTYRVEIFRE